MRRSRAFVDRVLAFLGRDVSLGRWRGIDMRVGNALLALTALTLVYVALRSGFEQAADTLTFVVLLFASVLLHEFGHAAAAKFFRIRTLAIDLNFFGGTARLARPPETAFEEFVISMAGPAVNLMLAGTIYLIMNALHPWGAFYWTPPYEYRLMDQAFTANMLLGVFNLLPGFPLDGGRGARALLTLRLTRRQSRIVVARTGQGFGILIGLAGGMAHPVNAAIGIMIFLAASQEVRLARRDQAIWS